MTPERWRQITDLFHAARGHDPVRREALLAGACREDATLRREVEAMLAGHDQGEVLDEASLSLRLSGLEPGIALGPYRIERLIGAGGMGEVYLARDSKLGRDVAVKILPRAFTSDPERLARFEREARMLAALNYPHVAAIYGLEEADGVRGLVLELVEGQTVDERLKAGPIPVSETLTIARQIAEALEAAHEKGIVHRDLKPANVKVTPDGTVKVLDFGLAKAAWREAPGLDLSQSPTLTVGGTREGLILGTAAYMSPEQARGKVVDKRADIWAFGCVLYEMLTGRAAFPGETISDTIAAILEREPDWSLLPRHVPDAIQKLLKRCLSKDPAARVHDIGDARLDILEAQSVPPDRGHSAAAVTQRERWLWMALTLTALAVLVVWRLASERNRLATPTGLVEIPVRFPDGVVPAYGVAVSPDGHRAAIGTAGGFQIWLYSLDSSEPRPLPGTEGGMLPFWSPDGSSIGFFTVDGKKLKRIDPAGGPAVLVCDVTAGTWLSQGGTWNANGEIVFASDATLFRVPASGGSPVRIALRDQAGEPARRSSPRFLPDNRHFIYHAKGPYGGSVYVASLDSAQTKHLLDADYAATYAAPNHLMFVRGTALMAQAFNPKTFDLDGQTFLIAPNVAPGFLGGLPLFSASNNGVLTFVKTRGGSAGQLTWFDRTGKALGSIPQPLGEEYLNPAISPNGEQVAVNRMDPQTGNWDIWIIDVIRGISSRFTSNPAQDADPVWSPDGKEILFASDRGGQLGLYRKAVNGSESEELVMKIEGHVGAVVPTEWSRDRKFILYSQFDPDPWSVWALPLMGDRKPIRVLHNEFRQYGAHLSPDSQWIAYQSYEGGTFEVYIQRFLAPGEMKQLSRSGGNHPRWTADGRELVYWIQGGGLDSVELEFTAAGFHAGMPNTLIATPILGLIDARAPYDVTRDGQRFLLRQPAGGSPGSAATVMLNWTEKLKR